MTTPTFSMGRVALTVRDLDRVGQWYERAVGLQPIARDGEVATYGAGDRVLLELRHDAAARQRSHREAGLFHSAFLLPTRGDLGRWLRDAIEKQTRVAGASDHLVSEAVYLTDPEGNGVEIYADRPRDVWNWAGGNVEMDTVQMDIQGVLDAGAGSAWAGAPEGTVMGHVHMQVGEVAAAETFLTGVLGLDVVSRYPGAVFVSAEGYHHHIAANIWNSRGAGKREYPATGLAEVEILLNRDRAEAIAARAATTGAPDRLLLDDPFGTHIALAVN